MFKKNKILINMKEIGKMTKLMEIEYFIVMMKIYIIKNILMIYEVATAWDIKLKYIAWGSNSTPIILFLISTYIVK